MLKNKQAFQVAGYTHVATLGDGQHLLADASGKREIWFANKGHASYGLIYKNTHLEFARSA